MPERAGRLTRARHGCEDYRAAPGGVSGGSRWLFRPARASALALVLALVLAVAGPLLPVAAPLSGDLHRESSIAQGLAGLLAAPTASAAEGIDIRTKATYTVDPAGQAVRVVIDITARNTTRDLQTTSGTTRYYYDGVAMGIQEEATRIRASAGGSTLRTKVSKRDGYLAASVYFARNLFYNQTTTVRLQYDLPSGAATATSASAARSRRSMSGPSATAAPSPCAFPRASRSPMKARTWAS